MEKPRTFKDYLESLKIYLFPFVSFLVILVLFNSIVKIKIVKIFKIRSEIKNQREKLSRLIEKHTALAALDETALKEQFLLANEAIPSKRDVAGLLAQVERIALETGLLIDGVSLKGGGIATQSAEKQEKIPQKKSENKFQSKVTIKGEMERIRDFLEKLLKSRRIIEVTRVQLSAPLTQVATPSAMTTIVTIDVFFKLLPETMGAADSPLPQITQTEKEVYEEIALLPFLSQPLALPQGFEVSATPSARISPFGP
ncbi:hypothetical protein ES702_06105 [subsurface metagenome]